MLFCGAKRFEFWCKAYRIAVQNLWNCGAKLMELRCKAFRFAAFGYKQKTFRL